MRRIPSIHRFKVTLSPVTSTALVRTRSLDVLSRKCAGDIG